MQEIFRNNPFLKLIIPFLSGLLLGMFVNDFHSDLIIIILVFLLLCPFFLMHSKLQFNSRAQNLVIVLIFFVFGWYRAADQKPQPTHYEKEHIFLAQLLDYPDSTSKSLKVQLEFKQLITDTTTESINGKAFVYMPLDSMSRSLKAGNLLLMRTRPALIKNQGNPGAFDFKNWAASKGFFYQFYLNSDRWKPLSSKPPFSLSIYLKKLRRKIFNYYRNAGITDKELSVFSALTLGDKSMLEHDLRQGYVSAGLMHVLAVSGLHVGIIYLVISQLLKPLNRFKWGNFLRFLLSIIVLWGYAMFTGMSPSVSRAATMFSVFVVGDLIGKRYAVYNSIALAAFLLLVYNPHLIRSVGFQMSFLAVMGIVAFYPIIYRWLYVPSGYLDKVWQLVAVSIAAQIITTPLSLYYFHQFPLLFLLSNLSMVPLATLLMYLFVLLLIFMPLPVVAVKVGWCVEQLTALMNNFTQWLHQLGWSTVKAVYVSEIQLIILYIFIGVITYWGFKTNYRNLRYVFLISGLLIISSLWQEYKKTTHNALIVFNTYNEPLMMQISGKNFRMVSSLDSVEHRWFTKPVITKYGLNHQSQPAEKRTNDFYFFGDSLHRTVFYNLDYYPRHDTLQCRWLVLSAHSPYDLKRLLRNIKTEYIIADAAVSAKKIQKWKETLKDMPVQHHFVTKQGAFVERW